MLMLAVMLMSILRLLLLLLLLLVLLMMMMLLLLLRMMLVLAMRVWTGACDAGRVAASKSSTAAVGAVRSVCVPTVQPSLAIWCPHVHDMLAMRGRAS